MHTPFHGSPPGAQRCAPTPPAKGMEPLLRSPFRRPSTCDERPAANGGMCVEVPAPLRRLREACPCHSRAQEPPHPHARYTPGRSLVPPLSFPRRQEPRRAYAFPRQPYPAPSVAPPPRVKMILGGGGGYPHAPGKGGGAPSALPLPPPIRVRRAACCEWGYVRRGSRSPLSRGQASRERRMRRAGLKPAPTEWRGVAAGGVVGVRRGLLPHAPVKDDCVVGGPRPQQRGRSPLRASPSAAHPRATGGLLRKDVGTSRFPPSRERRMGAGTAGGRRGGKGPLSGWPPPPKSSASSGPELRRSGRNLGASTRAPASAPAGSSPTAAPPPAAPPPRSARSPLAASSR